jgi:3-hydroxyisobutyrate dehydrogenase-like beta-hydroxyacid dehydrogenase
MTAARIGFLGFGEVGAIFAAAVVAAGHDVFASDVLAEQPGGLARLRERDRSGKVQFLPLAELVTQSTWIISTVTTRSAEAVARAAAAHLSTGKIYVDLNATGPALKCSIRDIVTAAGAHFVEGAILNAVGIAGAKTRILIGDTAGPATADQLSGFGLNAAFYSREIGRAAAFKLLRSVFSKGMEALLLEFRAAGRRAGIDDDLWREVTELFAANGFEKVADNWVQTHATAHERRYHEVAQVVAELRALGVEPIMTAATEAYFARSREIGLREAFAAKPATPASVVAFIDEATRAPASARENRLQQTKDSTT